MDNNRVPRIQINKRWFNCAWLIYVDIFVDNDQAKPNSASTRTRNVCLMKLIIYTRLFFINKYLSLIPIVF